MAYKGITWSGYLVRFIGAIVVVFATYNPERKSYFHWVRDNLDNIGPLMLLAGVILLIGWTILLRATFRSLGAFGLFLAFGFFGTLLWLLVDFELVPADSARALTYIVLVVLSGVLATGVSWSHVRRRITGQADVDEVDGDL